MPKEYNRGALIRQYRNYARSIGWSDHPMIAEQRVDLWLYKGCPSVDEAIALHEKTHRATAASRLKIIAGAAVMSLGIVLGVCVWFR